MDGIGNQRERFGQIAIGQLRPHKGQVQERANRKGTVEILGNVMVMTADAVAVPCMTVTGMIMLVVVFVIMRMMMPATTAVVTVFAMFMIVALMHLANLPESQRQAQPLLMRIVLKLLFSAHNI